jgi:hypothetical protein
MKIVKPLCIILSVVAIGVSSVASANCYGTANNYTCYDVQSGNSYNVQKYGNQTYMNGRNSRTGTSWSQNTNRFGNSSSTYGHSSNGKSWSSYSTPYGSSGQDSSGNTWFNR